MLSPRDRPQPPPTPPRPKKIFSSLIFSKKKRLGPPYFVAWAPFKIMNIQPSPCKF